MKKMNNDDGIILIIKKIKGTLSGEEESLLNRWIAESEENEQLVGHIESIWEQSAEYDPILPAADAESAYAELERSIKSADSHSKDDARVVPMYKRRWVMAAAATIALLITCFTLFDKFDIIDVSMSSIKTNAGQQSTHQLADGSSVTLNENSVLRYNRRFTSDRSVELVGEAFFDVTRNEEKPFVISTTNGVITVLGTSFTVREYPDEDYTELIVRSGRVRFESADSGKQVIVEKNGKIVFDHRNEVIAEVLDDNLNGMSWYTQKINFKNSPLAEVFSELEDLFHVQIELQNVALAKCRYSVFGHLADLDAFLNTLARLYGFSVQSSEDGRYVITGGNC